MIGPFLQVRSKMPTQELAGCSGSPKIQVSPRLASPVVLQMIQAFLEPLLGSTVWFVFRSSRLDGR